jgi:hypothetical protein
MVYYSDEKIPIWFIHLATEDGGIFHGHLVYFATIWYFIWPFGIFCGRWFGIFSPFWYVVPIKTWHPWFSPLLPVIDCVANLWIGEINLSVFGQLLKYRRSIIRVWTDRSGLNHDLIDLIGDVATCAILNCGIYSAWLVMGREIESRLGKKILLMGDCLLWIGFFDSRCSTIFGFFPR